MYHVTNINLKRWKERLVYIRDAGFDVIVCHATFISWKRLTGLARILIKWTNVKNDTCHLIFWKTAWHNGGRSQITIVIWQKSDIFRFTTCELLLTEWSIFMPFHVCFSIAKSLFSGMKNAKIIFCRKKTTLKYYIRNKIRIGFYRIFFFSLKLPRWSYLRCPKISELSWKNWRWLREILLVHLIFCLEKRHHWEITVWFLWVYCLKYI